MTFSLPLPSPSMLLKIKVIEYLAVITVSYLKDSLGLENKQLDKASNVGSFGSVHVSVFGFLEQELRREGAKFRC